jgi:hypothetical protein
MGVGERAELATQEYFTLGLLEGECDWRASSESFY